ncbi:MAG: hypothetical protein KF896_03360 [Ignavibacteriae bacterium]|nr:hypothetical protein [Ignavibacteriota bacterium]
MSEVSKHYNDNINYFYDTYGFCKRDNWRGFFLKDINKLSEVKGTSIKDVMDKLKVKYRLSDIIIGWENFEIAILDSQNLISLKRDYLKINGVAYRFEYDKQFDYRIIICFDSLLINNKPIKISKQKNAYLNKNSKKLLDAIQNTIISNNVKIYEGLEYKPIPIPDANKEDINE